jgi:hypothetical protein
MSERRPTLPTDRHDRPRDEETPALAPLRSGIDRSGATPWRRPTRRAFLAMLSAAAAATALTAERRLGPPDDPDDRPRSTWTGKTRWIGHC